jgi:UPF0716 protein FxsA
MNRVGVGTGFRAWQKVGLIIALAFPVLELVGMFQLWQWIGAWTLLWLLLAAFLGFQLLAAERAGFMPRLVEALQAGRPPIGLLLHSGLRFLAAVFLIIPGPITDALALFLLLGTLFRRSGPTYVGPRAANDEIIEGDFRRVDETVAEITSRRDAP